ncbi:sulfurtransferase TusA family protein [Lysinibacillus sp. UGB7]|uniref:sulfurtransferase TusA family protein n=1 Tax=Lysinibacillus sp. UGB7 TaxID=3411039 RepID=UPI003B7C42E3
MRIKADFQLDAKGLSCPMPIVKTKKAMVDLVDGQILEVSATDKGSKADIAAWAETVGHQYIGTTEEDAVLKHYIRKCVNDTVVGKAFEPTIELAEMVGKNGLILDVREEVEFAFGHIAGAKSIPLGDLEARIYELDQEQEIYVICRTGKRSDFAAQKLVANGFTKVYNVLPGMTAWTGELIKTI